MAKPDQADADILLAQLPQIFRLATAQTQLLLERGQAGYAQPRTFEKGALKLVEPRDWTSGFFPGSLWLIYKYTGEAAWMAAARQHTEHLDSIKRYSATHDVGFILNCSYGNGYRITQDPAYRQVLIQGAHTLATRFDPTIGLIRSWDWGPWQYPVIIDNMMNLELLMWAARETGETRFKDIALQHADKTLQNHFRPDASSYHVVDYDRATGHVLKKQTHQGAADCSAWARGQAWGLYGFTMMFRHTGRTTYLHQARRIAGFIIDHPRLPSNKIPYWDFDAPDIPKAPPDASAGAIMASALLELAGFADAQSSRQYHDLARQQLRSLSSPTFLAKRGENGGFILKHSVGNHPMNAEVDVPLNYADYYFLEALLRYREHALAVRG